MRIHQFPRTAILVLLLLLTASPSSAHERKEVAGMMVVFGAEPEPAMTEERQELVWRFRSLESEEPVGDLENLEAIVVHDGTEYGPFQVRGSRREPGTYRTVRIFTAAGDYAVTLTFNKAGEADNHSVDFDFRIADRNELAIPGKGVHQEGMEATEVVAAFHAALSAGDGEAALAHMAPEVVILESGGGEKSRDEYASHHLGGDMRFAAASERETLEQRQETFGDTAVVLTWTRTTGSFGDRQIDSNGVETMVLHRTDGQWRIVHVHWSSRSNQR